MWQKQMAKESQQRKNEEEEKKVVYKLFESVKRCFLLAKYDAKKRKKKIIC